MNEPDDQFEEIFVASITLRNGTKLFAASKGLKAFKIRVRRRDQPPVEEQ